MYSSFSEKPRIRLGCPSRSAFSRAPGNLLFVDFGRREYGYRASWRGFSSTPGTYLNSALGFAYLLRFGWLMNWQGPCWEAPRSLNRAIEIGSKFFDRGSDLRVGAFRNLLGQKRPTKPLICANRTKEFSEQFEGVIGHDPVKQGFWVKSHHSVQPNVRQNLCHTVSLWYLFCLQFVTCWALAWEQSTKNPIKASTKRITPPFCWTKFQKKVAKFETKLPKISPKFAPRFELNLFVLSWQAEKSSPKISLDFCSIGNFKFQIEFQIKFHQKCHKRTSAGLAALKKGWIGGDPSPKKERAPTPLRAHKTLILFWGQKMKGGGPMKLVRVVL